MKDPEKNGRYRAAIYARLSREDGDGEESDSIKNQKELIRRFLADKPEISVCMECVDDGYSGIGFERPGFRRMMREIDAGTINCIVVKDLSRFGRNFVEVGRYIEQIFPDLGIRFLAVNDHFDSESKHSYSDRILVPFQNLMNDAYCRDISVKVRSQLEIKRRKGEFIGAFAVYGYVKDASDHHRLMVDAYAAGVVRDIFLWKLEGASQQRIAQRLNERGELSPMEYKKLCGGNYQSGFQVNFRAGWTAVAVGRILRNEVYTGTLVQGRRTTPNHKVKKTIQKPEEEWTRVENCHPPIVEKEDFLAVKRLLAQDTRAAPGKEKAYLLSGLLFCGDCGQRMVRNIVRKKEKIYVYYLCGNHRLNKVCSAHRISEKALEEAVFLSLKAHAENFVDRNVKVHAFARGITGSAAESMEESVKEQRTKEWLLKKQEEIARYERLKTALCEALRDGLIGREEYEEMKSAYEDEIAGAQKAARRIRKEQKTALGDGSDGNQWTDCFWMEEDRGCRNMQELPRHLIVNLIESITFYEDRRIEIRFRYRDDYERILAPEKNRKKLLPNQKKQTGTGTGRIYRTAVYARLSVEDSNRAGDGESFAMQRFQMEKYVKEQEDMYFCGVFCDNGETGTNFRRPGFESLMEGIYSHQIDCVVVRDLSRFGRNYVEAGYYLEEIFPSLGIRFVAVNDSFDTLKAKDSNGMVVSLKNLVNDLYARDISQKTASVLSEKQKKGEFIGNSAPYGYQKDGGDRNKLVINPETAPIVREIFGLRLEGRSFAQIARYLNEKGVPCPGVYLYLKGEKKKEPFETGAFWQPQAVRRIIGNPVYVGHMAQGKRRKHFPLACEDWIVVENTHEAIVSEEIFEQAQAAPGRHKRDGGGSESVRKKIEMHSKFRGIVRCSDCGRALLYKPLKNPYFYCGSRGVARNLACSHIHLYEQELEKIFRKKAGERKDIMENIMEWQNQQEKHLLRAAEKYRRNVGRHKAAQTAAYENYAEGRITRAEYFARKQNILERKEEEFQKNAEIAMQISELQKNRIVLSKEEGSFILKGEVTEEMVRTFVREIRVNDKNTIEIIWKEKLLCMT